MVNRKLRNNIKEEALKGLLSFTKAKLYWLAIFIKIYT
ncbi:MAG: hypothetical protein K0R31_1950 [Clostridiales bacterium]|nr:hypothetical protein [Clostridiales bacterium]